VYGSFGRTGLPTATTQNATYDAANRILTWNGASASYDLNGNLTEDGTFTYTYNARNQLTTAKQGSTTLGSFIYDGLGRRVQKSISGTITNFVYDGWNVAQEKDSKNKITFNEQEGLSLDQMFSRTPASGSPSYLLSDALGSTVGLADTSGVVGTTYTYEPFGKTTMTGTSSTNPFGFTGRENDSTGSLSLYNYRARSYSPTLQRFLTEDPLGFAGGDWNSYAYGANGPTYVTDPSGLFFPFDWLGSLVEPLVTSARKALTNLASVPVTALRFVGDFAYGFINAVVPAFVALEGTILGVAGPMFVLGVALLEIPGAEPAGATLIVASTSLIYDGWQYAFAGSLVWGTYKGLQNAIRGLQR
jgi:RHS repeat-associated protein